MGGGFLFPILSPPPSRWPRGKGRVTPRGSLGSSDYIGAAPAAASWRRPRSHAREREPRRVPPAPRRPHPAPPRAKENSRLLGDTGRGARAGGGAPQPPSRLAESEAGFSFLVWGWVGGEPGRFFVDYFIPF